MRIRQRRIADAVGVALLGLYGAAPGVARAADTVYFSTSDAGQTKSVASWGVDTAWPNYDNVRLSVQNIGAANVDTVRVTFEPSQPLTDNGDGTYSLNAAAKANIDNQLGLAAMAGYRPLTFVTGAPASTYDPASFVRTIKATQEYINSKAGWANVPIQSIEVFNEPDWSGGEGSRTDLNNAILQLKAYPVFQNTAFPAASTLNSNNARSWYDGVPAATAGSSHLLGGSLSSWVSFIDYVNSTGKTFTNPELHSLGEAIVGAQHGMTAGTFWADALRARGLFVQASDGKQLGYYEDLTRQSAAAVYRAPNGKVYAFAGGLERFGSATSYHFVATDRDVYFNGIPVREYMLQTDYDHNNSATDNEFANYGSWSSQGAYADVETGAGLLPLDGYRWKIVNAKTGQVLEVAGAGTADGAPISTAADAGALNQRWNITRTRNGYVELFNANSGRTAEVASGSLSNGAIVRQWGTADNSGQQWYVEDAGGGTFYLRNAYTNKYMVGSPSNNIQEDNVSPYAPYEKWRFVLANPSNPPKALYRFSGNANDSVGANNATVHGAPTYSAGPTGTGQAVTLNGTTDYVQLPSGVASSQDITIAAYVKWDGGNAWQRIFDFGNNTTSYMFLTPKSADNTMRFAITNTSNGGEQTLDTSPLPTGQWVHLALTLGGNTGVLYVDGKPRVAGQILLNPSDIASTLNYIGKSQWNDPLFKGSVDEFRVYDYALDSGQVASFVFTRWTGELGSSWTASAQSGPKNWQHNLAATDNAGGSAVLFDDYASSFTVKVSDAVVTPASTQIDNRNNGYVLNGPGSIAGTGALTKNGAGALTVNNANTYAGGTSLNNGTLNLNNASAIGTGPLTIRTGATLDNTSGSPLTLSTSNAQTWDGDFTFAGTNALNMGGGSVTLTADRTITTNGTAPLTVGPISPSAYQFTKAGPGTLVLAGNTNVATTTVTNGTLAIRANTTTAGNVWVGYGNGGSGNLAVNAGGTLTANVVLVSAGTTPASVATGSGTLAAGGTINTAQWFVIGQSGAAGSGGSFTVNGGTLNVHTNAAATGNLEMGTFDAANATLTVNAGSAVNLLNNALLVFGAQFGHSGTSVVNQNGGTVTFYGDGGSTVGGTGRLVMASAGNPAGNYTYNLNGGTLTVPRVVAENTANNPTTVFTFNGGTLKAAANTTTFLQGLTKAAVQGGGALVDTNGNSVTIAQPLLHDTPLGSAPDGGLTKSGSGTLTLAGSNTYTGGTRLVAGTLAVGADGNLGAAGGRITFAGAAPTLRFTAPVATVRPVYIEGGVGTVDADGFAVSMTGAITGAGGLTVSAGSGSVTVKQVNIAGTLTVSAGTLKVAPGGVAAAPLLVGGLTVNPGAVIDLTDNDMVVDYSGPSPLAGLIGSFKTAYNNGGWNGPGLTSSIAAVPPANGATTLAIGENVDYGFTSFDGFAVDPTSVLIKYTYYGDVNLDGKVAGDDYALLDRSLARGGLAGSARWVDGDVNYDGRVTRADYLLADTAYGRQSGGGLSPTFLSAREARFGDAYVQELVAAVPEPGAAGLPATVVAVACRRRRGRSATRVTLAKGTA